MGAKPRFLRVFLRSDPGIFSAKLSFSITSLSLGQHHGRELENRSIEGRDERDMPHADRRTENWTMVIP